MANIGQEIYEKVERLTADGKMNKSAAFNQIADESGRRAGTVAANYYRVARQTGSKSVQSRTRKTPTSTLRATGIENLVENLQKMLSEAREEGRQVGREEGRQEIKDMLAKA